MKWMHSRVKVLALMAGLAYAMMGHVGLAVAATSDGVLPGYGNNISLAQAKLIAEAASKEAARMNLNIVIAIVDTAGHLVYYEKADDTQTASVDVAIAKANSANNFRRSTKVFEDAVNGGRTSVLGLPGAVPIEGGVPIILKQSIIGAIGISGATSQEDGLIAEKAIQVLQ